MHHRAHTETSIAIAAIHKQRVFPRTFTKLVDIKFIPKGSLKKVTNNVNKKIVIKKISECFENLKKG